MSVSQTSFATDYNGATAGTPLACDFPADSAQDIFLATLLIGGTDFINVDPADYVVNDLGAGAFSVTPSLTYASGITVRVYRWLSYSQPFVFSVNGDLPAERIEAMGDRCVELIQQVRGELGLDVAAVTLPPGSTFIAAQTTFADNTARGNATPAFLGQLGIQLNTGALYRGSSIAAGGWTAVPTGGATFANPTAVVGTSAVSGVAATAMRSDAAPALDPAIAPAFTGIWDFQNTTDSTSSTSASSIRSAGGLSIAKALYVGTNATLGATSTLFFNGNAGIRGAATNRISVVNNTGTVGFGIIMNTPDTMIIRALDNSANGNITAGALTATTTLGVTGVTTVGDDILINAAGKTLKIKAGTNAKGGTFTLVAGTAAVSNTSITTNSVITPSVKTVGGTIAGLPVCVPNPGVGFTATGGGTDTSIYNYTVTELI